MAVSARQTTMVIVDLGLLNILIAQRAMNL